MNKAMKIVSSIFLLAMVGIGIYLYIMLTMPTGKANDSTNNEIEGNVTNESNESIEEIYFQRTLHRMSHQKVKAENKWGNVEITDEQINSMLDELNKSNYKDEKYYRQVLKSWKKGDFSNAVEVHNRMWELEGGSTGKAERLLTEEEEQQYIEENFR